MIRYQNDLDGIRSEHLRGFFVGWRSPLSPDQHLEILQNSSFIVLAVDESTSKVVGFVNALSDRVHFAFIPMLEVLPEYQGQGIGSELMKRMLRQLGGITNVDLTCDPELQAFYERFGVLRSHGMVLRKYLSAS